MIASSRTRFVVIVDPITWPKFTAIRAVEPLVVNHVVAKVEQSRIHIARGSRIAARVMRQDIVVKRTVWSASQSPVTVRTFIMNRVSQTLGNHAPLD